MNELSQTLIEIQASFDAMAQRCPVENMQPECRHSLKSIAKKLAKAQTLAVEQQRRYSLMDDLYYSVGSKLNSTFDQDELLKIILDSLKKLIGFDAAGIFLVDLASGSIEAEVIVGYQETKLNRVRQKVGEGILGLVIANAQPMNIEDVRREPRYIDARTRTRSELAVPMISRNKVIGCINLESNRTAAFSHEDANLLETYATQATLAVERARLQRQLWEKKRLEKEIELARNIHSALLPQEAPIIPGFDLAGMNISSFDVGGDYYDFIHLPAGGWGLAIADVAGKGLGASLIMSGFRAALRAEVRHNLQPHQLMHKVNHFVMESTAEGSFVTAFYATLIGNQFSYINAGHNPPILLHQDGSVIFLENGGIVLGIETEQYYQQQLIELRPGDDILFYTDGLTEAMNPQQEEYGLKRAVKALKKTAGLNAADRLNSILQKVTRFTKGAGLLDDLTLMILSCK